ncbi:hypothetical protein C8J56DRAFT_1034666 [Mycena floridula]|nr:hypothetical protein C8J56DRAFT_1034666 [Mycena floridula]
MPNARGYKCKAQQNLFTRSFICLQGCETQAGLDIGDEALMEEGLYRLGSPPALISAATALERRLARTPVKTPQRESVQSAAFKMHIAMVATSNQVNWLHVGYSQDLNCYIPNETTSSISDPGLAALVSFNIFGPQDIQKTAEKEKETVQEKVKHPKKREGKGKGLASKSGIANRHEGRNSEEEVELLDEKDRKGAALKDIKPVKKPTGLNDEDKIKAVEYLTDEKRYPDLTLKAAIYFRIRQEHTGGGDGDILRHDPSDDEEEEDLDNKKVKERNKKRSRAGQARFSTRVLDAFEASKIYEMVDRVARDDTSIQRTRVFNSATQLSGDKDEDDIPIPKKKVKVEKHRGKAKATETIALAKLDLARKKDEREEEERKVRHNATDYDKKGPEIEHNGIYDEDSIHDEIALREIVVGQGNAANDDPGRD